MRKTKGSSFGIDIVFVAANSMSRCGIPRYYHGVVDAVVPRCPEEQLQVGSYGILDL